MISKKIALLLTLFQILSINVNCGVQTNNNNHKKKYNNHDTTDDQRGKPVQTTKIYHNHTVNSSTNQYNDPNCAQWGTDQKCIKCAQKSYFKNGICVQSDPNCKTFNQNDGKCTSCYVGYELHAGNCELTQSSYIDPLCHQFKDGKCVQCDTRAYFGSDGCCMNVDPLCATFDIHDGSCLTCYAGYKLDNHSCIIDPNWKRWMMNTNKNTNNNDDSDDKEYKHKHKNNKHKEKKDKNINENKNC